MSLRTEHINYDNGQQKVAQSCRVLGILINTHTTHTISATEVSINKGTCARARKYKAFPAFRQVLEQRVQRQTCLHFAESIDKTRPKVKGGLFVYL